MFSALNMLIEGLIFGLVVAVSILAMRTGEAWLTVHRRLGEGTRRQVKLPSGALLKSDTVKNRFLAWVQASTLQTAADRTKLRGQLAAAGFDSPAAPALYELFRFGMAIGLPVLFLVAQGLSPKPLVGMPLISGALLMCAIGLIGPRSFVDRRAGGRREQMEREFPDTLDLMVVCVEAGLGLEAAFIRVGEEVRDSHPRCASEFRRLTQEISAGRSRADAMRAMAERVQVDTVRSFVALMIQTDSLGVSIAHTLRTFAVEMRDARFVRAETKAMRIPVLLTVPLVACILPVIIAALMLPAVIDVSRSLMPALSGKH
jgi:tight adherence protein C